MSDYTIARADNGYVAEWWIGDDDDPYLHRVVFEVPDECDIKAEDPQALIDLLYFVKDEICGQYHSKHKRRNVVMMFEEGDNGRN